VNAHEFLDALEGAINSVLPKGTWVSANHDFEARERYFRERRKDLLERMAQLPKNTGGGVVRIERHRYPGDSEDVPPFVKMMRSGQTAVQLEFHGDLGAGGTFLQSYLWEGDPPSNDGSAPAVDSDVLLAAAIHALDDLQDAICEKTREPWPRSGVAAVPPPGGKVEGKQLLLWYGEESAPVLRLSVIDIGT
jgi:hypothetical protein